MLVTGLRAAHLAVRLVWLAGTLALLALIVVPAILPALGRQVYVVRGASMQPAIPLGSMVVVHAVDPTTVVVGEVVTFRLPQGTVVTHRVTAITQSPELSFQTKGDANPTGDPVPLPASELVGSVEYALPGVGFLMYVLGSVPGALLAVSILGALLLMAWSTEQLLAAVGPISSASTGRPVGTLT
jgi:signal peptidase I